MVPPTEQNRPISEVVDDRRLEWTVTFGNRPSPTPPPASAEGGALDKKGQDVGRRLRRSAPSGEITQGSVSGYIAQGATGPLT